MELSNLVKIYEKKILYVELINKLSIFFVLQIILALAFAAVYCAPQSTEPIPILRYDNEGVNADGSYQWR